jgi:hypothetical protein
MADIQQRIEILFQASQNWLDEENHYLKDAIDRTVREGYFSFEDVTYAIRAIKKSLSKTALQEWADRAGLDNENDASGQNVLCLHAGNIPLVGFQDALSTLLSGARYTGKISRKDPYLLPTFLNEVKKTSLWTDMDVQWSHRLHDFEDMQNDAIIFAGSETSVPGVKEAIKKWNLARDNTRFLIRTAHFSIAYFDHKSKRAMQDLVEGIFRYGGKGCRSVAVVISPFSLDEIQDELINELESFWLENPPHEEPTPKLRQQYAYNRAIERSQLWLDYFLLQEGGVELDQDFVCYWLQGDKSVVADIADRHSRNLQSIYITKPDIEIPGWQQRTEMLADAQQPPISWKPDGTDTLEWLMQ